jgi:hypothetical protein
MGGISVCLSDGREKDQAAVRILSEYGFFKAAFPEIPGHACYNRSQRRCVMK